jgi:hypothetical protein
MWHGQRGQHHRRRTGEGTANIVDDGDSLAGDREGPPPIAQVSVEAATGTDPAGFAYAPPLDRNASLSGEQAVREAWSFYVEGTIPSSATAILANVTWTGGDLPHLESRDVWIVTYPDACVDLYGPYRPGAAQHDCVVQTFSTIIDADTGKFLVSFAPGSSLN